MRIAKLIPAYLREMKIRNYSPYTIRVTKYNLLDLTRFLTAEQVDTIEQLTADILEEYQQDLCFRLTAQGKLLGIRSQEKRIGCAKGFTRFLYEKDYLAADPGARLKLPQKPRSLPRTILTDQDIRQMLSAADMRTNRGYRNRIILELLYDTGIRRLETVNIKTHDLDLAGGYLHVHGKGNKDRVVPVSGRVCSLIRDYLLVIRPTFVREKDEGWLILNRWGGKMDPNGIWQVVKQCARLARIKKNVSTHTFRHTCATHMLKNGAPIRHIQELLGHESLESTQIYTKVTINDLKEIHAKYHPSENMAIR
jgi:integrase/recombinase XerD